MLNSTDIQHDQQGQCFLLDVGGQQARLDYRVSEGDKPMVNFTHTFVPPSFRGQGHAEKLVRYGLKWAKEQGYEIQASCWYVGKFLR